MSNLPVGISHRYLRIMEATGLTKEELDRQREYMLDAMDILASRILELEKRITASEQRVPLEEKMPSMDVYRSEGIKVRVMGEGTYLFPLDARIDIRGNDQPFGSWSLRYEQDDDGERIDVNGPRLVVRPVVGNGVQLERDYR